MLLDLSGPPANPSSVHTYGAAARKLLQEARRQTASVLGRKEGEVIFTSGATEAMNLLLRGLPRGHLITTEIEHSSLYNTAKTLPDVTFLKVGLSGAPTPNEVEAALRPDTKAIVLSSVNGETGVKLDLHAIAAVAERAGVPLFLDIVAQVGKEPLNLPPSVAGFVLSAHKFHGPKGTGALILRPSIKLTPLLTGGHQEMGRRSGTENLAGILGLAKALTLVQENEPTITKHLLTLRTHFESELLKALPDISINGTAPRTSNTSNIAFLGSDGETLLLQLDMLGIAVSHGSACASGALEPSRVLTHMGLDRKTAKSSLRFSFSRMNTVKELDTALEIIVGLVRRLRKN
jgi:cysteine desulfurase